jgi:hypothetical protein
MKKIFIIPILLLLALVSFSQKKKEKLIDGMYIQWGYNREWYTHSNIHFIMSNGNDFILHNAKGHDQADLEDIYKETAQVSIPQYNYRVGFYLNKTHTKSVEINFDHIKYVVTDGQTVHVTGKIDGVPVDGDSVLNYLTFLHLEHTNGGNLLHINYAQQNTIFTTKSKSRPLVNLIWKLGGGITIPKTDFTWRGDELNNEFHVAGYSLAAEAGARLYPFKNFFIELTGKTGYVRYLNALINTKEMKGNRVRHGLGYFEVIGTFGYDISF